jgi:hypothetical protein
MTYIYEFNSIEWWLMYNEELEGYVKAFKDINPTKDIEKKLAVGEGGLIIIINITDKDELKSRKKQKNDEDEEG